ncbi:MAG TPA: hypothetical protein VNX18_09960 [Bryobacteraceae bacterium]|nr:hypothetical protein [Bryobacteraceae bacterium]
MFKLGVYRLDQFQRPRSIWGRLSQNRISFHLLRAPASADQVRLFECAMPQIRLSNGVYRTTSRARFKEFDPFVNAVLAKHFEPSRELQVHDWAASDCIASSEWAAAVWSYFPNARVTASDLTLFVIETELPGGEIFIWETNGEPLQYVRPPFVVRLSPSEHPLMVVNRILEWHGRNKYRRLQGSWKIPQDWISSDMADALDLSPFVFRKIPLIHPEADALRRSSDRFAIIQHSAFESLERPVDVIRTMNIFNLKYFPAAKIEEGIEAVRRSLSPGGIWIVGRTFAEDPPVHGASVLIKDGEGFRLLERFGEGSEVESFIHAIHG